MFWHLELWYFSAFLIHGVSINRLCWLLNGWLAKKTLFPRQQAIDCHVLVIKSLFGKIGVNELLTDGWQRWDPCRWGQNKLQRGHWPGTEREIERERGCGASQVDSSRHTGACVCLTRRSLLIALASLYNKCANVSVKLLTNNVFLVKHQKQRTCNINMTNRLIRSARKGNIGKHLTIFHMHMYVLMYLLYTAKNTGKNKETISKTFYSFVIYYSCV